jgi:hypothetical protein
MMKPYNAIAIVEDINDGVYSEEEYLEAWQHLVDTGMAWQLQGWFGRMAHALIEEGAIDRPDPNEPGRTQ